MPTKENILIYVLRRDLRLDDNPIFHEISQLYLSGKARFTHVLPIYIFNARQIEVSGFYAGARSPYPEAKSHVGKFWRCGPHRAKFLCESVWGLKQTLESVHSGLCIRAGSLQDVVRSTLESLEAEVVGVWMTGDVTPEELEDEANVRSIVEAKGKEFRLFNDEKYFIHDDDLPIRDISELPDVFTTYRKSLGPLNMRPRPPHPKPALLPPLPTGAAAPPHATFREPDTLSSLLSALLAPLPTSTMGLANPPRWPPDLLGLAEHSAPERALGGGEAAAAARLHAILARGIVSGYAATRNGLLGDGFSTRLSGYLALGCVTARRVHAQMALFEAGLVDGAGAAGAEPSLAHPWRAAPGFGAGEGAGGAAVRCELLWRDYMRLCARKSGARLFALEGPRGAVAGPQQRWRRVDDGPGGGESDGTASSGSSGGKAAGRGLSPGAAATAPAAEVLHRYLEGRTGAGLIDASQRELFLTGHTSSRARQNAASFLAKHMRLDWRVGAEWYECMLVDYDAASCWANWAYAAGVGNDPREERIFNPVKQALEYDPRGAFVTAWVPELRGAVNLDDEDGPEAMMGVFQPWRLDDAVKERLGLSGVDWVERPLVRIEFSVGKKPRSRNGKQRYYRFRARKGHRDDGDRGAAERAGA